ncbi:MAG: hypothetical protein HYV27_12540 [Candidatus Hydrogenedentes bacterium]|nr:hypothetical protein [Candidatus Hydrogenedentota bacterium]
MNNIAEFYGIWGATAINAVVTEVDIDGVGTVRVKDFSMDLDITGGAWPPWVPAPPLATGTGGGDTVRRIRMGIERFFITDINNPAASAAAASTLPVAWDTFGSNEFTDNTNGNMGFNHVPGGSNVLFMDGHAAFFTYPGSFPIVNDDQLVKENSHHGLL